MDKTYLYGGVVAIGLVLIGGKFPKVALSITALIFLGALLLNVNNFNKLIGGN